MKLRSFGNTSPGKTIASRTGILMAALLATFISCGPSPAPPIPAAPVPVASGPSGQIQSQKGFQGNFNDAAHPQTLLFSTQAAQTSQLRWNETEELKTLDQLPDLAATWTGYLSVPEAASYSFFMDAGFPATLNIDGKAVTNGEQVDLKPNQRHWLVISAPNVPASGSLSLEWSSPSFGRQVLPSSFISGDPLSSVLTAQAVPVDTQIVANPGFENGFSGWIKVANPPTGITLDPVGEGSPTAAKVDAATGSNYLWFQSNDSETILPNARYRFDASVKTIGAAVCYATVSGTGASVKLPVTTGGDTGFTPYSMEFATGADITSMAVYLNNYSAYYSKSGSCVFDNVKLTLIQAPRVFAEPFRNLVQNGEFEKDPASAGPLSWKPSGTPAPLITPGYMSATAVGLPLNVEQAADYSQLIPASSLKPDTDYVFKAWMQGLRRSSVFCKVTVGDVIPATGTASSNANNIKTVLAISEKAWNESGVIFHTTTPAKDLEIRIHAQGTTQSQGASYPCSIDKVRLGPVVNDTPVAPPPNINLSNPVSSIGTSSTFSIDDTDASSVSWNFGDGSTATGSGVTHTFAQPGLYTATVTVAYPDGHSATAQQQVAVLKAMKDIPAQRSISDSMTASFDAGDPLPGFEYTWTFGDGATGTGSRIQHTYPQIGTYDFTLGIRDTRIPNQSFSGARLGTLAIDPNAGVVFSDGGWVTVWRKAPVAALTIDTPASRLSPPSPIAAGNYPFTANFNASASSDMNLPQASVLKYDWDFGDGTPALIDGGATPSHQYTTEGQFPLILTVRNTFGLKDVYRSFVYSHDIRANIKLNTAYETIGVQSIGTEPIGAQNLRALSNIQTYTDYYPYVLHKSYSFKGGVGYSLNTSGTKINSFCTSMEAYVNGGPSLASTKLTSPTDDGSGTFCNGVLLSSGTVRFSPRPINELLISNDSYLNTVRASVFSGLVVPRINIAIYPDEFLPGDQASPFITTSTFVNTLNGKTEWMMNVRIRESEMVSSFANGAQLRFKVPVMAVDTTGKFMNTVNGRFKAAFTSNSFTSDCGDCTMLNGNSSITVTMAVNNFTLSQNALDFSTISLGNDSASRCASDNNSSIYVKYGVNGCVLVLASNEYPSSNAPALAAYKYPISDQASFFGHVVFGETADKVRAFREYTSVGIYSDLKDFVVGFVPFLGSGKGFMDALNAYKAQGMSVGSVANVFLAGAGVLADASPLLSKALKPFLEGLKASQAGTKGVAKALDAVVGAGVAAGKTPDGIKIDLTAYEDFKTLLENCDQTCKLSVNNNFDILTTQNFTSEQALKITDNALADAKINGISPQDRLNDLNIYGYCSTGVGGLSLIRTLSVSRPGLSDWCALKIDLQYKYGNNFSTAGQNYADTMGHILTGNTTGSGSKYSGGHLASQLPSGSSITNRSAPNSKGVYRADLTVTLDILTEVQGQGVIIRKSFRKPNPNSQPHTFFPDSYSADKTVKEIVEAYQDAVAKGNISGSTFTGVSSSGIIIKGSLDPSSKILNAYPVL